MPDGDDVQPEQMGDDDQRRRVDSFFAFVGFYYHYLALERLWTGQEKKGDHGKCLWLPWVLTLAVAGPYCAIYTVTLLLVYGFKLRKAG